MDVPLQIDSTIPEVLEAALRVYAGKPIVNSVNGEEKSLETVLPLVKKYGACVVGLALDENGIPKTAEGRFEIAKRILAEAEKSKRAGTLSNQEIDAFYQSFAPMLYRTK